ncbi:MAG: carbon-nitrogen hydrolase [Helicobacteraceae bacterium]
MDTLKVGFFQAAKTADKTANRVAAAAKIQDLARRGAQLIVMQELHEGLYFCQSEDPCNFDLAEEIPGGSTEFYGQIAAALGVVLVLSLFERRAAGLYHNTAAVIEKDGKLAGIYRKMHIPDDPGFYEKFYFTPGDLGFSPIQTSVGKLGVLVCWDQWYPEAARIMALKGAQILIYPTAIGWDESDAKDEQTRQLNAWELIQRSHAVANALPVVSVNRVGREGGILFWGHSFAAGAQGEILKVLGQEEESAVCEINLARTESVRRMWPFFRDRRIDEFGSLQKRFLEKPNLL